MKFVWSDFKKQEHETCEGAPCQAGAIPGVTFACTLCATPTPVSPPRWPRGSCRLVRRLETRLAQKSAETLEQNHLFEAGKKDPTEPRSSSATSFEQLLSSAELPLDALEAKISSLESEAAKLQGRVAVAEKTLPAQDTWYRVHGSCKLGVLTLQPSSIPSKQYTFLLVLVVRVLGMCK